jgi:hypothetical protein
VKLEKIPIKEVEVMEIDDLFDAGFLESMEGSETDPGRVSLSGCLSPEGQAFSCLRRAWSMSIFRPGPIKTKIMFCV